MRSRADPGITGTEHENLALDYAVSHRAAMILVTMHRAASDQKRYVRVLAVLNCLKFYVLYAFFQLFGLLCVVSSLDVFIGDLKLLKAGIVVLLM
jgi:hypothetical protein